MNDTTAAAESERNLMLIVYGLHGLALFNGLTAIVGVIISHLKVNETQDEFIRSHHRWLIRTFWLGVIWAVVCGLLSLVAIGLLGFVVLGVWWIYRVVRGILNFVDKKPMPLPA